ncbi:MAG: hypothetical protein AAFZ17_03130 [Cyanobacteria bacterium J06650_10]
MKKPSREVRILVSVLSVIVVVSTYAGVATPDLVHNALADILVLSFFS